MCVSRFCGEPVRHQIDFKGFIIPRLSLSREPNSKNVNRSHPAPAGCRDAIYLRRRRFLPISARRPSSVTIISLRLRMELNCLEKKFQIIPQDVV
ncbi:unnamed protein product [Victoria cruziana]